jgi:hypothetical protein
MESFLAEEMDIDMSEWQLREALAISDDGSTIAGYRVDPSGVIEGWVFTTVPEPSTALLLALGLMGVVAGRRLSFACQAANYSSFRQRLDDHLELILVEDGTQLRLPSLVDRDSQRTQDGSHRAGTVDVSYLPRGCS